MHNIMKMPMNSVGDRLYLWARNLEKIQSNRIKNLIYMIKLKLQFVVWDYCFTADDDKGSLIYFDEGTVVGKLLVPPHIWLFAKITRTYLYKVVCDGKYYKFYELGICKIGDKVPIHKELNHLA